MVKLNNDILHYIFQELNNDGKSLLSCLLVNKRWCELVIPILWKYPLKYFDTNDFHLLVKKKKILLNIILSHLPETSKQLIITHKINIISEEALYKKLSFNYIRFCKYISVHNFLLNENIHKLYFSIFQIILLEQEIFKLFVRECSNIRYLDLGEIRQPIYQYPGADICLLNLNEVYCKTYHDSSLFYGLAHICKFIEKIYIEYKDNNPGLVKLIKTQKRIKYIKVDEIIDEEFEENDVVKALEEQAQSIIYLNLSMQKTFSCILFSKFVNLQTLILSEKNYVEEEKIEKNLTAAVYSKLQVLELEYMSPHMAIKIIQNTGGNLWKIKIRTIKFKHSKEYIQAIYKNCPHIKYASIFLNNQTLDELEMFFTKCQHLEAIDIIVTKNEEKLKSSKFLDLLIKFAPNNLYKVHIDYRFFSIKSLKKFFSNWKGKKILHLYDHISNWCSLIEQYDMNGVIGHIDCRGFWDDDNSINIAWND
ncbi:hypothetical protein RclHR1_01120018 [Rhizophagus clarus]|uniref:F-box domain-containing protein n=1 Tax=Rhizophagus clarus TaxID=94130 RepID=A0A2Z6Q3R7_9GLOM|nr:hypothetical protein RclHR1_01120018 [Rhizophagus clarus]GET04556.1 hypothetical protein GLOIN_2v1771472 [Rhizophagus clarus]